MTTKFKVIKTYYMLLFFLLLAGKMNSQVKSGTADMKSLKKPVYGGTYSLTNGNKAVFFYDKDEVAAYEFDNNARHLATHDGAKALGLLNDVDLKESTVSKYLNASEIQPGVGLKVLYASESWGALKLVNGLVSLSSTDKFINGFELEEKEKKSLKIEGTWRTSNIGARAIIPADKLYYKFKARNGKFMSFDFTRLTTLPIIPVGGYLQSAGVITEKVSIKEPSPYNANRLVIFKIGFNDEETSNIHIMPLAMRGVGVGSDARDNMVVMTVPLNAPSTYSPHKQLNAKDEERRFLYLFRFDNNNNLIDEQKIKSDLVNINNYQTLVAHKKTYVIGTGSVGNKGFISSFPGQNTDALSIAVIDENGKLSPFKTFSGKELEGKLETNNVKPIMKFIGGPNFYSVSELDNGNVFLFGKSDGWHHGVLLSSAGDLIKYYIFPHLDPTKNTIFTEQLHNTGKKIFILLADQPKELTNEKQTTTGSSTSTHYMGGGSALKTTTTTTTTTQLFEIFHLSNVYIIDGANGVIKKIQLDEEVKNFYTLSDVPAFFTNEGMYIPGRIKANKGKTVSLIKIDL